MNWDNELDSVFDTIRDIFSSAVDDSKAELVNDIRRISDGLDSLRSSLDDIINDLNDLE